MAKVAIYLRVSTVTQDASNQLAVLEKWVQGWGHELVAVYQEQESAWREGYQH